MSLKRREILVESVSALSGVIAGDGDVINLLGYYSPNDGGGQQLRYLSTSSGTIDDGFIFNGPSGVGRFEAVDQTVAYSRRFGCLGDGSTDDSARFQAAVASPAAEIVYGGQVRLVSDITVTSGKKIRPLSSSDELMSTGDNPNIIIQGSSVAAGTLNSDMLVGSAFPDFTVAPTAEDWICILDDPALDNNSASDKCVPQQLFRAVSATEVHDVAHVDFRSSGATVYAVTPIEKVDAELNLNRVRVQFGLAVDCSLKITTRDIASLVMDIATPVACESCDVDFRSFNQDTVTVQVPLRLVGVGNSKIYADIASVDQDGCRIYSCVNCTGDVKVRSYASRAIRFYRSSGNYSSLSGSAGPRVATGNIENILFDFCENLTVDFIVLLGHRDGDGIEIRGIAKNISVGSYHVETDVAYTAEHKALNIHPTGGEGRNIHFGSIYSVGCAFGVDIRDDSSDVSIEHLVAYPSPLNVTSYIPIRIGRGIRTNEIQDVVIHGGRIQALNGPYVNISDADSTGFRIKNVTLSNLVFDDPTQAGTSLMSITSAHDLLLDNINCEGATDAQRLLFNKDTRNVKIRSSNFGRAYIQSHEFPSVTAIDSQVRWLNEFQGASLVPGLTFFDTFTDVNNTALVSHNPDISGGVVWQETGSAARILTNRGGNNATNQASFVNTGLTDCRLISSIFLPNEENRVAVFARYVDINNWIGVVIRGNDIQDIAIVERLAGVDTYHRVPVDQTVADETARLALSPELGERVLQTDTDRIWVLDAYPASDTNSWGALVDIGTVEYNVVDFHIVGNVASLRYNDELLITVALTSGLTGTSQGFMDRLTGGTGGAGRIDTFAVYKG